jgi:uncharacterized membrane protein
MIRDTPDALNASGRPVLLSQSARWRTTLPATGLVLLVSLLALMLRLIRLNFQPLWWDEGYSVWFATHPIPQIAALTAGDIHPPLYYIFLHLWTLVAGAGPVAVRLVSVAVGVAAVALAYVAGRRILGNTRAALLAAFLFAINPLHIYYSQEVRMYGLVALFSLGILLAAWEVIAGNGKSQGGGTSRYQPDLRLVPWLLVYVLLTLAALYTQYYAAFLPVALTLYGVWRWRRDVRKLALWLAAQAVVVLLYLPWVIYAAPRLVLYVSQKIVADDDRALGLAMYLARHLAAFAAGHLEGFLAPLWPLALVLLVPLVLGLVTGRRRDFPSPLAFLSAVLSTALVLGWLVGLRYPFFPARGERLLLLALPPFLLLLAAALDKLAQLRRPAFFVSLALLAGISATSLSVFYLTPRYADDDYRPLVARTVQQGLPEDTIFCVYPWQVGYWRAYGAASGPVAVLAPAGELDAAVQGELNDALDRGRVWFPAHLALGAILETQVEGYLAERALPFANEWYGPGTRLSAWSLRAAPVDEVTVGAVFAVPGRPSLTLERAAFGAQPLPAANSVLPVALDWQAESAPPVLAVSVRLVDDLGQIWAQHDYEPLGQNVVSVAEEVWQGQDRLGVLIGAGTPPGKYHIEVAASEAGSERALQVMTAQGSTGTKVRLFDVDIVPADRALGPERLPIATRATIDLDNGVRFLGYTTEDKPLTPGELRRVSLFWQASDQPADDYSAFVQLLDGSGAAMPLWEAAPGGASPTSLWAPGMLMRTQAMFRAPAALPDGRYGLIAGLFRPSDGARARTSRGRDAIEIGTVRIKGRPHQMQPPSPRFATDEKFGAAARLVGYDLPLWEVPPIPGETIPLTLHWQAQGATDRPYTVFVHLIDDTGKVWGYGDSQPGDGVLPTTGWLAGEYLADLHEVSIAADAPAGRYRLAIGLYDEASGARLTTASGRDRLVLDELIEVRVQ